LRTIYVNELTTNRGIWHLEGPQMVLSQMPTILECESRNAFGNSILAIRTKFSISNIDVNSNSNRDVIATVTFDCLWAKALNH